jgi:hypothetical protein
MAERWISHGKGEKQCQECAGKYPKELLAPWRQPGRSWRDICPICIHKIYLKKMGLPGNTEPVGVSFHERWLKAMRHRGLMK